MKTKKHKKVKHSNARQNVAQPLPNVNEPGLLILTGHHSALFIKPPAPQVASQYTLQDIENMMGERGEERYARKQGQSGIKMYKGHTLWIKSLKDNVRIECHINKGAMQINDNGQIRTVPSFTPSRVGKKK